MTSSPFGRSSRNSTASSRIMFAKSTLFTCNLGIQRLLFYAFHRITSLLSGSFRFKARSQLYCSQSVRQCVNLYWDKGLHCSSCSQYCLGNCRFYCIARTRAIPHYSWRKEAEVQIVRYMALRKWDKHCERKQFFCVCAPSGPLLRNQPGGTGILEQPVCKTMTKKGENLRMHTP